MKVSSYNKWIDVGYELFSEEGHEGIQVERLARITGFNKSGFYHYFGDKDLFFDHLIQCHLEKAEHFSNLTRKLIDFDPSFIQLLLDEKTIVFFEMQLNRNRNLDSFNKAHMEVSESMAQAILPIWSEYLGLSPKIAKGHWEFMRDSFNSRITLKTYSFEFIRNLTTQFRATVIGSIEKSQEFNPYL